MIFNVELEIFHAFLKEYLILRVVSLPHLWQILTNFFDYFKVLHGRQIIFGLCLYYLLKSKTNDFI